MSDLIENYYYDLLNNLFVKMNEDNSILLFIKNKFHILDHFSHIIKKKNIQIDIHVDNIDIHNELMERIKGEECEDNIQLYLNIEDINNKTYNFIYIFHLDSNIILENILNKISNIINNNTFIHIYFSASTSNDTKINYKNYFRKIINDYTNIRIGNVLKLNDVIFLINSLNYDITSLKIYKKNNYILYGNNNVYHLILKNNDIFFN